MDHLETKEKPTSFIYEPVDIDVSVSGTPELLDVVLEPVQQEYYNLSYTCLFVTRFPSHQLRGDLADFLPGWLKQTCIAYGWRLEFAVIGNESLQWALGVPPSDAPARFLQIIRQQTSKLIFENFGRIRQENPSDDFWAMGYYIRPGIQQLTEDTVNSYVNFIRRQQGLMPF